MHEVIQQKHEIANNAKKKKKKKKKIQAHEYLASQVSVQNKIKTKTHDTVLYV